MSLRARRGAAMRGFTLLEVLVALVIVAFGMGAVLSALSGAAVNIGALREKTLAQWVALNRVADARLNLQAPQTGTTEGDVKGFGNGDWHWQQIVTSMQEIPGLQQITVSVRRNPGSPTGSSSGGSTAKITNTSGPSSTGSAAAGPWITTVIGFRGDALQAASGEVPGDWSGTDNTNISTTPNTGATTGTVPNPGTSSSSGGTTTAPVTPSVPVSPGGSSSGGP